MYIGQHIYFVGNISTQNEDKDLIDFGILTLCDHMILSHGTFGMWAALLASNENVHLLPHINQSNTLEEERIYNSSDFKNFVYIDE